MLKITYITITDADNVRIKPFLASIDLSKISGNILNRYCQEQTITRKIANVIKALVINDNTFSPCSIDPFIDAKSNSATIAKYKTSVNNDLYLLKAV